MSGIFSGGSGARTAKSFKEIFSKKRKVSETNQIPALTSTYITWKDHRPKKNYLSAVPPELTDTHIRKYLKIKDNYSMSVDKLLRDNTWKYNEANTYYELDLRLFTDLDKLKRILKKVKDIKKLKIRGLNNPEKLELFINSIHSLDPTVRFHNLSHLDLKGNGLSSDSFARLNTALLRRTTSLTSLNLADNIIGNAGARVIANSKYMNKLTSLNLASNEIQEAGARAIANSKYMNKLTSLNLASNEIQEAGARAIANSEYMNKLTSLNLADNIIGNAGARAIANSKCMNKLTSLNLADNIIGNAGARAIANSEYMNKLTSLNLADNSIGEAGARAIANSEYMNKLTLLYLADNSIGEAGARAIANSKYMKNLTLLDLHFNGIGDDVARAIRNSYRHIVC